jgi:hypothetical protein
MIDRKGNAGGMRDRFQRSGFDQASGRLEMKRCDRHDVMTAAQTVVAERLVTAVVLAILAGG